MVQDTPWATPRSFLHPSHQVSCSMSCMPTTAMPYIRPVLHNGMKKHSQHTPSKILSTKSTKSSWYAGAHWSHLLTNIARIYSPFWKAAVTVWPQPGLLGDQGQWLHSCPPPCTEQAPEPGRWHRHQGRGKLGMALPSSQKDGVLNPPQWHFFPQSSPGLTVWSPPSVRRPLTTSSPTQLSPQPTSSPLGRNHHVQKPGHPFWINTTIHEAYRTASWARSCLSRQCYSISWVGWRFSYCNMIFLF